MAPPTKLPREVLEKIKVYKEKPPKDAFTIYDIIDSGCTVSQAEQIVKSGGYEMKKFLVKGKWLNYYWVK